MGLDYITDEERQTLEEIKEKRAKCNDRIKAFRARQRLLALMMRRLKAGNNILGLADKDSICGYDSRLAMNEAQFAHYVETTEGKTALETMSLGPRTAETMEIGHSIPHPKEAPPADADIQDELKNMCLTRVSLKSGSRKKCRHDDWINIHNEDYALNISNLKEELAALDQKEKDIIEDAETREATKEYDAHNTVEVLF